MGCNVTYSSVRGGVNTLNVLLLRHIFLFQDLVHLSRRGWTLELLTVQQLIFQLFNSLNQKRHFNYWWDFLFPSELL